MMKKFSSIAILFIFLCGTVFLSAKAPEQGALVSQDEVESMESIDETEYPAIRMEEEQTENSQQESIPPKLNDEEIREKVQILETTYKTALEKGNCLEVCDYIELTQEEFMEAVGNTCEMITEGDRIIGNGSSVNLLFDERGMKQANIEISYATESYDPKNAKISDYAWTVYDIPLYSSRDEIENGCLSGAVFSWLQSGSYAYGGLELQKKGIQYLYICGDSEIFCIMVKTNPAYVEQLKDYEYKWEEETFTYENKTKNVDIQIKYPVLEIPAHPDTAKQVNENIQEAAFKKISDVKSPEELESYELRVDYRIENAAGDYISIRFDGIQRSDGVKSVFATGSTSSILEGGKKVRLDEVLGGKEELKIVETTILETDYYSKKEKERRISELFSNYEDYVITPFFVEYFGKPSEFSSDKCTVTMYARDPEYRDLDWG